MSLDVEEWGALCFLAYSILKTDSNHGLMSLE